MLILSWTINHGENKLTDNFELFTDEQELQEYMANKSLSPRPGPPRRRDRVR